MQPASRIFQAIRIAGFVLLAAAVLAALINIWFFLTPISGLPHDVVDKERPLPPFFFISVIMGMLLLLSSLFLTRNRIRLLSIYSACVALIFSVAWIRSYNTDHVYTISKTTFFPDHVAGSSLAVRTGDGGLCFASHGGEDWERLHDSDSQQMRTQPWQVQTGHWRFYPEKSHYPWYEDSRKVWKDGWLDSIGIRFWSYDAGTQGVRSSKYSYFRAIAVPYWFLLIFCLPTPAIYATKIFLRRRRVQRNCCIQCGYQLHSITSDKCPECGTPVPKRKEIANAPDTAKPAA